MTTGSHEERISRLEGAFELFATVLNNMVTREEHQASMETLRAEYQGSTETLRAEYQGSVETLRAAHQGSMETLRHEMRAEIRASELRLTRWIIGSAFSMAAIVIAATKLWP